MNLACMQLQPFTENSHVNAECISGIVVSAAPSYAGNLHLQAGNRLHTSARKIANGATLSSTGRSQLQGRNIDINAAVNTTTRDSLDSGRRHRISQHTSTQSLTGGVVSAGSGTALLSADGDINIQGMAVTNSLQLDDWQKHRRTIGSRTNHNTTDATSTLVQGSAVSPASRHARAKIVLACGLIPSEKPA